MRAPHCASLLLVALTLLAACSPPPSDDRQRRRSTKTASGPRVDSVRPEVQMAFEAPASWDTVRLSRGVVFHQPPRYGLGLSDATLTVCDSATTAEVPVFNAAISDRWPLTLALRRGDLNRMARANGFVLDSTVIATQGQPPGDSTLMRRGEGWMLVSGRTMSRGQPLRVLFGTVRYPGGCYLVMAARGVDISVDTLGMVLSTIRYNR
ncbi:MAG TPA: hypothetical protein VKH19_04995 [Gemmatimonadaceae bacterium]|nr:hypothetical protein [Gemmatimonadaceae bacterium]